MAKCIVQPGLRGRVRREEVSRRSLAGVALGLIGALSVMLPTSVAAQVAQGDTVNIIVPYAPGAATDALGRLMAQALEKSLGVTAVVENRGGGGSQIGTQAVAGAEADGHTLGFVDTAFAINPGLFGDELPYDTLQDFTPLSLMATAQLVLVAHPSVEAKTMEELVALAKSAPGTLTYGSAGLGSAPHLAGEQLASAAEIDIIHVPYPGGGTVISDLLGGHIQLAFTTVPTMRENITGGLVIPLAVTGAERSALLPDVPTMTEAGLPDVNAAPFFALVGPQGLPDAVVQQFSKAASDAVREGELRDRVESMGFIPVGSVTDEFSPWLADEVAKWTAVIEKSGIKPTN